ncbi:MAG: hypothetical protein V3U84_08780 [Thiotrichaceae bacterium]
MRLIRLLTLSSILLLGCTDSKENKLADADIDADSKGNPTNAPMNARSVAQKYQVTNTEKTFVKCLIDITQKQNKGNSKKGNNEKDIIKTINLRQGQHVFLATGTNTTIQVEGVYWLRVIPNDIDQQSCYVQTIYLSPVADYSPKTSQ